MTETTHQLRQEVRGVLLDIARRSVPDAREALRHASRLRFALARVEEQAHAAVMESALYTSARHDAAISVLRADIERARAFVVASADVAIAPRAQRHNAGTSVDTVEVSGVIEQRAA
jgi:hypothetical protein